MQRRSFSEVFHMVFISTITNLVYHMPRMACGSILLKLHVIQIVGFIKEESFRIFQKLTPRTVLPDLSLKEVRTNISPTCGAHKVVRFREYIPFPERDVDCYYSTCDNCDDSKASQVKNELHHSIRGLSNVKCVTSFES